MINSLNNIPVGQKGLPKEKGRQKRMILPSRRRLGAVALMVAGLGAFLVPFLLHSPSPQGTSPTPTGAKDNTSSSIACSPSTIAMGGTSSCTASVPDTTTASNVPTGTVSFASSNPGVGTVSASCSLSAGKCTADFTSVATGTATITGTYGGDSSHNGSSGSSNVVIATHTGNGNGNGEGGGNGNCGEAISPDPGHDKGNGKDNGNAFGLVKNKMDTTVALMKAMGKSNPAFHLHHDTDTDSDEAHGSKSIHNPGDNDSSCAAGEEKHE